MPGLARFGCRLDIHGRRAVLHPAAVHGTDQPASGRAADFPGPVIILIVAGEDVRDGDAVGFADQRARIAGGGGHTEVDKLEILNLAACHGHAAKQTGRSGIVDLDVLDDVVLAVIAQFVVGADRIVAVGTGGSSIRII